MTAQELHELVRPLIGTACEPKGLRWHTEPGWSEWWHEKIFRYNAGALPVEAAAAMWEVAIMDWLFVHLHYELCFWDTSEPARIDVGTMSHDLADRLGSGPTRLHALVAAAVKVQTPTCPDHLRISNLTGTHTKRTPPTA